MAQNNVAQTWVEVVSELDPSQRVSQAWIEVIYLPVTDVDLTWDDDNTGVTFNLERSNENASSGFVEIANGITLKQYTDIVPSGEYWYRVRAYDGLNYSDYSNVANLTIS